MSALCSVGTSGTAKGGQHQQKGATRWACDTNAAVPFGKAAPLFGACCLRRPLLISLL